MTACAVGLPNFPDHRCKREKGHVGRHTSSARYTDEFAWPSARVAGGWLFTLKWDRVTWDWKP